MASLGGNRAFAPDFLRRLSYRSKRRTAVPTFSASTKYGQAMSGGRKPNRRSFAGNRYIAFYGKRQLLIVDVWLQFLFDLD